MKKTSVIAVLILIIGITLVPLQMGFHQNDRTFLTVVHGDHGDGDRIESVHILQNIDGTYEQVDSYVIGAGAGSYTFEIMPYNDTQIWVKVLLWKDIYAGSNASNYTRVYVTLTGAGYVGFENSTMVAINATESGSWDHCWKVLDWNDALHPVPAGIYNLILRYQAYYDPDDR
jgi:hypothetical protein